MTASARAAEPCRRTQQPAATLRLMQPKPGLLRSLAAKVMPIRPGIGQIADILYDNQHADQSIEVIHTRFSFRFRLGGKPNFEKIPSTFWLALAIGPRFDQLVLPANFFDTKKSAGRLFYQLARGPHQLTVGRVQNLDINLETVEYSKINAPWAPNGYNIVGGALLGFFGPLLLRMIDVPAVKAHYNEYGEAIKYLALNFLYNLADKYPIGAFFVCGAAGYLIGTLISANLPAGKPTKANGGPPLSSEMLSHDD